MRLITGILDGELKQRDLAYKMKLQERINATRKKDYYESREVEERPIHPQLKRFYDKWGYNYQPKEEREDEQ